MAKIISLKSHYIETKNPIHCLRNNKIKIDSFSILKIVSKGSTREMNVATVRNNHGPCTEVTEKKHKFIYILKGLR